MPDQRMSNQQIQAILELERRGELPENMRTKLDEAHKQMAEMPTGDAFLKTLDPARASQVKALAEGRMALPSGFAMKSPVALQLLADVAQYDSTFDLANAPSRIAARKAFTSGAQGKNITSFNTAIGHLGELAQAADDLNNSKFPIYNRVTNAIGPEVGDTDLAARIKRFNTAKQAVVEELGRAFKGAAPDVHATRQWEGNISASDSPEAIRSSIQEAAKLLHSRIGAMQDSYNASMGTVNQPLPMLNEHASQALNKFESKDYLSGGYNAVNGGSGPDGGNPPAGGISAPPGGNPPAGGPSGGNPPSGGSPQGGAPSPWNNPSAPTNQLRGAGPYSTDKDTAYTADIQKLLSNPKTTRGDFDALSSQYGYPKMGSDLDEALKYRAANPNVNVNVQTPKSGNEKPSLLNDVAGSATGAFLANAANAGTFGTMNKINAGISALGSRLSNDNRPLADIYDQNLAQNNLKTDLLNQAHPVAALGGEVAGLLGSGSMLGSGLKAAGEAIPALGAAGARLSPGVAQAGQDALQGGLIGAGSSNNLQDAGKNAVLGAALGGAGSLGGQALAKGASSVLAPAVSPAIQKLTDAGITMTPGQILGQGGRIGQAVKGAEDWMAGLPGVGGAINSARRKGTEDFNRAALNEVLAPIGQKAEDIGHSGIADVQNKVNQARQDAISQMKLVPDEQLQSDLQAVKQDAGGLSKDHQEQFQNILNREVEPYIRDQQALDGSGISKIDQGLNSRIANLRGPGASPQDRELADALDGVRGAIFDSAGRTSPDAVDAYQAYKKSYSLLSRVEDAAKKADDGVFTANQFKTAVGRLGYGTSRKNLATGSAPFQELSNAASTVLPSKIPDSGTAGRNVVAGMLGMHGAGAALGGTAGYAEGGQTGALTGALVGAGLGSAAFSRPALRAVQNTLAGSRPAAVRTLGDILRDRSQIVGSAVGTPMAFNAVNE